MENWAENIFLTLGIVVTSIFVIFGCGVLFLLALCFGALTSSGHPRQTDPQAQTLVLGAILAACVLIALGIFVVSMLARAMARNATSRQPPYPLVPPAAPLSPSRLVTPSRPIDVRHLSPSSRTAIQRLGLAITAKIAAEVALGLVGWYGALSYSASRHGAHRVPFPLYRFGFLAWGLAAIAPHLVLLYALARRPGPRAFAYALAIPTLHIVFGLFGHSAFLAFVLRSGQTAAPLLSILPWILDLLIFYLAWKSIRLTGIVPNPARLIVASVVIVLYSSLLPAFVVFLNYYRG